MYLNTFIYTYNPPSNIFTMHVCSYYLVVLGLNPAITWVVVFITSTCSTVCPHSVPQTCVLCNCPVKLGQRTPRRDVDITSSHFPGCTDCRGTLLFNMLPIEHFDTTSGSKSTEIFSGYCIEHVSSHCSPDG